MKAKIIFLIKSIINFVKELKERIIFIKAILIIKSYSIKGFYIIKRERTIRYFKKVKKQIIGLPNKIKVNVKQIKKRFIFLFKKIILTVKLLYKEFFRKTYDYTTHGDFRKLYDTKHKKNYWLLGYFGGGGINMETSLKITKQFAIANNVPYETVYIDEILYSRRYKSFKFVGSTQLNQQTEVDSDKMENVMNMLHD